MTEAGDSNRIESDTVVLDVGSTLVKAGYAGEDSPWCVFKSSVASKSTGTEDEASSRMYPVRRGIVEDWDKMERLWTQTLDEELGWNETCSVLIAESPEATAASRAKTAHIMFEKFKVPSLCFFNSAALSLFASGRTRGLVLDIGGGISHAVPVFEGFALAHAVKRLENAGQDITVALAAAGLYHVPRSRESIPFHLANEIKQSLCRVASLQHAEQVRKHLPLKPQPQPEAYSEYELPDGTLVEVLRAAQTAAPELLFTDQPKTSSTSASEIDDSLPIPQLIAQSIALCDRDLQADMRGAVVLAGGTTMLPGFCARVKEELVKLFPDDNALRVIPGPNPTGTAERGYNSQRKYAAWIGGSMFASLDTFNQVRVLKQEWEDDEHIVHRKAF